MCAQVAQVHARRSAYMYLMHIQRQCQMRISVIIDCCAVWLLNVHVPYTQALAYRHVCVFDVCILRV